jgi:hypothetical protein
MTPIYIFLLLFSSNSSLSHNKNIQVTLTKGCALHSQLRILTYEVNHPSSKWTSTLMEIGRKLGLDDVQNNVALYSSSSLTDYAVSGIDREGRRIIIINEYKFEKLDRAKYISILLHEIAHIANHHYDKNNIGLKDQELFADRFIGVHCDKFGVNCLDAASFLDNIDENEDYPTKFERKNSILSACAKSSEIGFNEQFLSFKNRFIYRFILEAKSNQIELNVYFNSFDSQFFRTDYEASSYLEKTLGGIMIYGEIPTMDDPAFPITKKFKPTFQHYDQKLVFKGVIELPKGEVIDQRRVNEIRFSIRLFSKEQESQTIQAQR